MRPGRPAAHRDRSARIWRRCRIAASATNRPTSPASLERWPRSGARPAEPLAAVITAQFRRPFRVAAKLICATQGLSALTLRAKVQYCEADQPDVIPLSDTAHNPPVDCGPGADFRADPRGSRSRRAGVRPPHPVARRADSRDGPLHPEQRRQARAPGRAADGRAAEWLHAAIAPSSTRRSWSSSTPRRWCTTTSSMAPTCAADAWRCTRDGATTSRSCSATTSTSSRWRWR